MQTTHGHIDSVYRIADFQLSYVRRWWCVIALRIYIWNPPTMIAKKKKNVSAIRSQNYIVVSVCCLYRKKMLIYEFAMCYGITKTQQQ